jgi:hypothetical protein
MRIASPNVSDLKFFDFSIWMANRSNAYIPQVGGVHQSAEKRHRYARYAVHPITSSISSMSTLLEPRAILSVARMRRRSLPQPLTHTHGIMQDVIHERPTLSLVALASCTTVLHELKSPSELL